MYGMMPISKVKTLLAPVSNLHPDLIHGIENIAR